MIYTQGNVRMKILIMSSNAYVTSESHSLHFVDTSKLNIVILMAVKMKISDSKIWIFLLFG